MVLKHAERAIADNRLKELEIKDLKGIISTLVEKLQKHEVEAQLEIIFGAKNKQLNADLKNEKDVEMTKDNKEEINELNQRNNSILRQLTDIVTTKDDENSKEPQSTP